MSRDGLAGAIDLKLDQLQIICAILAAKVPGLEVWAFGSRVSGQARTYSDLDIALISTTPLPLATKAELVEAFAQAELPFMVDIVDWAVTGEAFRRIIEADKVVLQTCGA